jgi:hypothetical protein
MNIQCDEAKIPVAPEPLSPALRRTVFFSTAKRRPDSYEVTLWTVWRRAWPIASTRPRRRSGAAGERQPLSLEEERTTVRAHSGLIPSSLMSGHGA